MVSLPRYASTERINSEDVVSCTPVAWQLSLSKKGGSEEKKTSCWVSRGQVMRYPRCANVELNWAHMEERHEHRPRMSGVKPSRKEEKGKTSQNLETHLGK